MASDTEIKKLLDNADWDSIYKRLLAFAERLKQLYEGSDGHFPLGHTPEDIVQIVIEKAYSRERVWDPEKGELILWLFQVTKSEISNLYDKATDKSKRRREVPLVQPSVVDQEKVLRELEQRNYGAVDNDVFPNMNSPLPEEWVLKNEEIEERYKIINGAIDDDNELFDLYAAMIEIDSAKPQELAENLGIHVKEVYKRTRRLRYQIDKQKKLREKPDNDGKEADRNA